MPGKIKSDKESKDVSCLALMEHSSVKMTLHYQIYLEPAEDGIHAGLQSSCSAGDSMQYACCNLHNSAALTPTAPTSA